MPIVSGNVSLYNETDGTAILPTPTIGAVGLLDASTTLIGMAPSDGDALVLLGEQRATSGNPPCWPNCSAAKRATRRPST